MAKTINDLVESLLAPKHQGENQLLMRLFKNCLTSVIEWIKWTSEIIFPQQCENDNHKIHTMYLSLIKQSPICCQYN